MVKEGEERVKLETSTTSKLNRFQNSTIWLENSNQTGVTCLSLIREKLAALELVEDEILLLPLLKILGFQRMIFLYFFSAFGFITSSYTNAITLWFHYCKNLEEPFCK